MRALRRDPQNSDVRIRLDDVVVDLAAVQVIRVPARAGRSSEVTEIRLTPTVCHCLAGRRDRVMASLRFVGWAGPRSPPSVHRRN